MDDIAVSEGANMPSNPDAVNIFQKFGVVVENLKMQVKVLMSFYQ